MLKINLMNSEVLSVTKSQNLNNPSTMITQKVSNSTFTAIGKDSALPGLRFLRESTNVNSELTLIENRLLLENAHGENLSKFYINRTELVDNQSDNTEKSQALCRISGTVSSRNGNYCIISDVNYKTKETINVSVDISALIANGTPIKEGFKVFILAEVNTSEYTRRLTGESCLAYHYIAVDAEVSQ